MIRELNCCNIRVLLYVHSFYVILGELIFVESPIGPCATLIKYFKKM